MAITEEWFSLPCPNGCEDPMIHETEGDEHVVTCQTCDLIDRADEDSCDYCAEEEDSEIPSVTRKQLEEALANAQQDLSQAMDTEEESEEAMDSMERRYWEGVVDTLENLLETIKRKDA